MNEWRKVKLGEIGEIVSGGTPKTTIKKYWNGNISWLTPKDFSNKSYNKYWNKGERSITKEGLENSSAKLLPKGTVLFTSRAPIGYIGIAETNLCTNQGFKNIVVNGENSNEFTYYLLKFITPQIINIAGGSTFKEISATALRDFEVCIPKSKKYQGKIAKILSDIDKKIELNNKINDNLEKQCITIFKKMFSSIFYGSSNVGNYLKPKHGKNLLSKNAILGDVPVVAGGLEPAIYHNKSNTQSPVITISASGANAGFIRLWHIPVWSSDSSYIDYSVSKYIYFWYVFLKLRQNEIYDLQSGSAQPHIYPKHLEELSTDELDIKLVENFNEITSSFFEKIGKNNIENKKLSNLKNYLLPKLMNGKIDVENIEL